jgi:DNA-directed RNA polymerase subunit RPC12/RpoP
MTDFQTFLRHTTTPADGSGLHRCPYCRRGELGTTRHRHRNRARCPRCGYERWTVVAARAEEGGRAGVAARARANARQAHVRHWRSGLSKLAREGLE